MRTQITVDKTTKELVERLSKIAGCSESCVYSFGIALISHEINDNCDKLFEDLYTYFESYYKLKNKQGGKNEKKTQTFAKKSQNISEPWRLPSVTRPPKAFEVEK